jgi:hypothetical protein
MVPSSTRRAQIADDFAMSNAEDMLLARQSVNTEVSFRDTESWIYVLLFSLSSTRTVLFAVAG